MQTQRSTVTINWLKGEQVCRTNLNLHRDFVLFRVVFQNLLGCFYYHHNIVLVLRKKTTHTEQTVLTQVVCQAVSQQSVKVFREA